MLAVAVVAAAWGGAVARSTDAGEGVALAAANAYVVRDGDTLWSIAQRLAPGEDPRPLVDAMSSANAVDAGALVPGQTLVVPIGS